MNRARAVLTALVLLSALGVAGCSDDPEPKFEPTPTEAPSSAATTDAAALESPEDVVRAWVDAQNEALTSGDVSAMEALSSPHCKGCAEFSASITEVITAGGRFEGGAWHVQDIHETSSTAKTTSFDVATAMDGGLTIESRGAEPVEYEADKQILVFDVTSTSDGWRISLVGFVE